MKENIMREVIVQIGAGCHECKLKTQSNRCYIIGKRVMKAIKSKTYHTDCPGVESQMAKE